MKHLIYLLAPIALSGCITHELMSNLNDVHSNTATVAQQDNIEQVTQSPDARRLQLTGQENTYTFNLSHPVADDLSMFMTSVIDQLSFSIEASPDSYHAHEDTIYRPNGFNGQLHICYDAGGADGALTNVEQELIAHIELTAASYYCNYHGYEKRLEIRDSSIVPNRPPPAQAASPADAKSASTNALPAPGSSDGILPSNSAAAQAELRRRIRWQQAHKKTGINPDVMFIPLAVATDVLTMPIQLIGKGVSLWLPSDSAPAIAPQPTVTPPAQP